MIPSTEPNILETFEEKKLKSKALMEQLIFYCIDGNYFPLPFTTTSDPRQMQRFVDFFKCISAKFNTIYHVYKIEDFPETENIEIANCHATAHYWMNACVTQAKFILLLLDKRNMTHPILHDKLIQLLSKVHEKICAYFKITIWAGEEKMVNL